MRARKSRAAASATGRVPARSPSVSNPVAMSSSRRVGMLTTRMPRSCSLSATPAGVPVSQTTATVGASATMRS